MSKTVSAIIIKFVFTMGAAWIAFSLLDNNPSRWIFVTAALATTLNYIVADLVILPSRSNLLTTGTDAVLSFLSAYIVSLLAPGFNPEIFVMMIFAVIVAVIEYFFHSYLIATNKITPKKE